MKINDGETSMSDLDDFTILNKRVSIEGILSCRMVNVKVERLLEKTEFQKLLICMYCINMLSIRITCNDIPGYLDNLI
jgi:hypothetical protein